MKKCKKILKAYEIREEKLKENGRKLIKIFDVLEGR